MNQHMIKAWKKFFLEDVKNSSQCKFFLLELILVLHFFIHVNNVVMLNKVNNVYTFVYGFELQKTEINMAMRRLGPREILQDESSQKLR